MGRFLTFERMITPVFIQILFWLGVIASFIAGIIMIIFGFTADHGFFQIVMGVTTIFFGPIIVRIYCEMFIVIFKMQGSLLDIRDSLTAIQEQNINQASVPHQSVRDSEKEVAHSKEQTSQESDPSTQKKNVSQQVAATKDPTLKPPEQAETEQPDSRDEQNITEQKDGEKEAQLFDQQQKETDQREDDH